MAIVRKTEVLEFRMFVSFFLHKKMDDHDDTTTASRPEVIFDSPPELRLKAGFPPYFLFLLILIVIIITIITIIIIRFSVKLSFRWHHHNYHHWAQQNLPLCVFLPRVIEISNKGKGHICDIHWCCCNLILKSVGRRRRSSWNRFFNLYMWTIYIC